MHGPYLSWVMIMTAYFFGVWIVCEVATAQLRLRSWPSTSEQAGPLLTWYRCEIVCVQCMDGDHDHEVGIVMPTQICWKIFSAAEDSHMQIKLIY